jgi:hypothetical protein
MTEDSIYKVPNFITDKEREELLGWAIRNSKELNDNPASRARKFNQTFNLEPYPMIWQLRERIADRFDLHSFQVDNRALGDWLGEISTGGAVHIHKDVIPGHEHHRVNILIQLPLEGGINIYNGTVLEVEEKMLLYYRPDLYSHGTTEVVGEKCRYNLSFGFLKKAGTKW